MNNSQKLNQGRKLAIIVHGGAWNIPDILKKEHLEGVSTAIKIGYNILMNNGTALDAVESTVINMENNPIFDAGIGSFLNENGEVELDALIMEGQSLKSGAVGAIRNCLNPISLARLVMEKTSTLMLVGLGAEKFAEEMNLSCNPKDLIIPRELERWNTKEYNIFSPTNRGTVGAVALDKEGNLACATSTGGSPRKKAGRLGDSSLIGCGGYANNFAAVSSTGHGEYFMKIIAAKSAVDLIEKNFHPQDAVKKIIANIELIGGFGGMIAIDKKGNIGYFFNTNRMAYAYIGLDGILKIGIDT